MQVRSWSITALIRMRLPALRSSRRHLVARVDVDAIVGGGEGVADGLLGAELFGQVKVQTKRGMQRM